MGRCQTIPGLLALVSCSLLVACGEESSQEGQSRPSDGSRAEPWFQEQAARRGLDFVWASGHEEVWYMPEIMGGGAALFDPDRDGDLDLYLVQAGSIARPRTNPPNRFYRNGGDGSFLDETESSGAGHRGYGMGAAVGDVDGDGFEDLYVTNVGPNALFLNLEGKSFESADAQTALADGGWGTSAAFFDLERDGDLDLFVCNYLVWSTSAESPCTNLMGEQDYCSPKSYSLPAPDLLFRNDGRGVFEDISLASGVAALAGTGLGVVTSDFDGDGWIDVFVANDGMPDRLWRNGGGATAGRLNDVAALVGVAVDENGVMKAGMGVAVADLDSDGDPDLLIGNLNRESDSLFINQGGWFADRTARSGLGTASRSFTRFGLGLIDFDHDGRLDLFQANGRVNRHAALHGPDPYAEPNLLFRGSKSGRFEEVLPRGGTGELLLGTSRAAVFGDVDGDGDLDVVIVERDDSLRLLINRAPKLGDWILLDVREDCGRVALGARIELRGGNRSLSTEVRAASSYLASSDPRVHFGLGQFAPDASLEVEVIWVDGTVELFGPLGAKEQHLLQRGAGH